MNEFYNPNRKDDNVQTVYDEPADEIKIVVDDRDNDARFCVRCGNRLDSTDAFCSRCGAQTYGDDAGKTMQQTRKAMHADRAAQRQQGSQPNVVNNYYYNSNNVNTNVNMGGNVKSKYVSLILCLFFGVFGVHRFYEGKILSGIVYALTGGLFGIGWIIDLLILIFKPRWYNP